MDIELIKKTAIAAALKAGYLVKSLLGNVDIGKKSPVDLVTEADINSEKIIMETIRDVFYDHMIIAEESGGNIGNSDFCWVIDPIDGTTNFAHQLPAFAISIGFSVKGIATVGVVYNPINGELFTAIRGQGAMLNDKPIHVSNAKKVSESLLATGFPYNFKEIIDELMTRFKNCIMAAQGLRRIGAAALDLCNVACGRIDGYWEQGLKPWDTAAGFLIVQEAGGKVTDFTNQSFEINKKEVLATNGEIHDEMVELLRIE